MLTHDQAFAHLVHASQHQNVKLRDIAERVVRTGDVGPAGDQQATTQP